MNTTDTVTLSPADGNGNTRVPMNTRVALRDLLREMKERDDALIEHIDKRHKRDVGVMIVVGIVAVIVGMIMGSVIVSMEDDMDTMAEAMGYLKGNDDAPAGHAAKRSMTENMDIMADSIEETTKRMETIATVMGNIKNQEKTTSAAKNTMAMNMDTMAKNTREMSETMSEMKVYMSAIPEIRKDVNQMTRIVGMMQQDTGSMRVGVGHMSNDTGSMSHPFRVMNSMMPW
uniref:Uncharacterized protein n=1 Tax=Candidatus Kentrum sp. SD TaxID=2126332 RepID=A0A450YD07_9GAMM|nr:MAG: hypothetical protein BECKSD772F_GA0070984_103814 [Candidatus Kentron sp. SD]VFK41080.1 MAG: hypothetical protein BECKSD772E_GA0070983_100931 [Candidatus Kentron sp. SD]